MSSQAGARYRESSLVQRHKGAIREVAVIMYYLPRTNLTL